MTNPDYTHWHLIVDRSGSMMDVRDDAQGGINKVFEDQRALPGKLTVSLTEFDTSIDSVQRMRDIADVVDYTLVPRGGTALLDAVGRAITETGEDLADLPEGERPTNVIIQIVTDGHENSSREWSLDQIQKMIAEQQEKYGWVFAFIGAGDGEWGRRLGTNTVSAYVPTKAGTQAAYGSASVSLANTRSGMTYAAPDVIPEN